MHLPLRIAPPRCYLLSIVPEHSGRLTERESKVMVKFKSTLASSWILMIFFTWAISLFDLSVVATL